MGGLILGVDAGNYRAKTVGPYGADAYRTSICDWFQQDFAETFGDDDMEFEIAGRKGFAGSIAASEDQFGGGGATYGDSKAHDDTLVRVLLAIYRYTEKYCPGERRVSIVTGQPVSKHNEGEKVRIIEMLRNEHVFLVNGDRQRIIIDEVNVAGEGAGVFWSNPQKGLVRNIDPGSGTLNCVTVENNRIINNATRTFNFGTETVQGVDLQAYANGIIRSTMQLKWQRNDFVNLGGDIGPAIYPYIKEFYANTHLVKPVLQLVNGNVMVLETVFANANGFYEIAKGIYR